MLTRKTPSDWKELQQQVAEILRECGFSVEIERKTRTVRGDTEIDVYAEQTIHRRRQVILCECKHWKNPVPQNVIHAFRTTVADVGANFGYVIASSGFQSGAFSAAELTNLDLVTWLEFQERFEGAWLEGFSRRIAMRMDPLLTYSEPLLPEWYQQLPQHDQVAYRDLKAKYDPLGHLVMSMTHYVLSIPGRTFPTLPLRVSLAGNQNYLASLPAALIDKTGYRDLEEELVRNGDAAIAEFRAIRARSGVTSNPADFHE